MFCIGLNLSLPIPECYFQAAMLNTGLAVADLPGVLFVDFEDCS